MGRQKLTPVQVDEVIAKYQSGKGAEKIALDYGVSAAGIRWILKSNGIEIRKYRRPLGETNSEVVTKVTTKEAKSLGDDSVSFIDEEDENDGDSRGRDLPPSLSPSSPSQKYVSKSVRESRIATNLAEAQIVAFIPKEFRANSVLLQVAKSVCEQEWHWPNLPIGDWLDTYLYLTMRQRGIVLGSYQKIESKPKLSPSH